MDKTKTTVLAIAAHPDDIEMSCAGTLIKLKNEGHRIVLVDCTLGELGSRGSVETRKAETVMANIAMGINERVNLKMEDGNIIIGKENILKTIEVIRKYQPQVILFPQEHERHPDHENVHSLVRKAVFQSGLSKIETKEENEVQKPHRPDKMYCFMQTYEFSPDFYVDVSDVFEQKVKSIEAYSSQVHLKSAGVEINNEPTTFISKPEFMEFLEARARYFGGKIGVKYAEAFYSIEPIGLKCLSNIF